MRLGPLSVAGGTGSLTDHEIAQILEETGCTVSYEGNPRKLIVNGSSPAVFVARDKAWNFIQASAAAAGGGAAGPARAEDLESMPLIERSAEAAQRFFRAGLDVPMAEPNEPSIARGSGAASSGETGPSTRERSRDRIRLVSVSQVRARQQAPWRAKARPRSSAAASTSRPPPAGGAAGPAPAAGGAAGPAPADLMPCVVLHTYGRKRMAEPRMPDDVEDIMRIECLFMNQGERSRTHVGTNENMLETWSRMDDVRAMIVRVKGWLLGRRRAGLEKVAILCYCNWGRHRSVGMATMLLNVLERFGVEVDAMVHHCQNRWQRWGCGWAHNPCTACDNPLTPKKQAVYRGWMELFTAA